MKEFLEDLKGLQAAGESVAVATLVRVEGSAPRLPGARLCCTRAGAIHGSVSAGCVENDVFERACQVLESGEAALVNYGIAQEEAFQVGLSCGGSIDVLIESFKDNELWEQLRRAVDSRRPVLLATVISPSDLLGKRALCSADALVQEGLPASFEPELKEVAQELMAAGSAARVQAFSVEGEEIEVFLEPILPPRRLYIVGGNDHRPSQCLCLA